MYNKLCKAHTYINIEEYLKIIVTIYSLFCLFLGTPVFPWVMVHLLKLMDFIGDPQTLAIPFRIILIFTICFSCKRIKS